MNRERTSGLAELVNDIVFQTPAYDIHTHLYDRNFGELLLWGIDDLLTYHYLVAEVFRRINMPVAQFWDLSKAEQAELIWKELFVQRAPLSEACRGVLSTLSALGFDTSRRELSTVRRQYADWKVDDFITRVMELARVRKICMTNSPFDDLERPVWERRFPRDERFSAALRVDPLLVDWTRAASRLHEWGYDVREEMDGRTFDEVRRFLADWTGKINAQYCMVSLPADFTFPDNSPAARLIEGAIMPHGRELGQAFAMMIGVRRNVNPALRLAGDSVGPADVGAVERICAAFPQNKFLCTILARENQHALCVAARKFRNLHIFGCWWFLNTPSLIEEITRMRLELIGTTCTPQHSDCRVLDQLVYKWEHSRAMIARVLTENYSRLSAAGWEPNRKEIEQDVEDLLGGAFEKFLSA